MSIAEIAARTLQGAFNRCLAFDSLSRERFAKLQGKVIAIELLGVGVTVFVMPEAEQVVLHAHYEGDADVTLSGSPFAFARMGLADDSADTLFKGDVSLTGDSALGQHFGEVIKGLEIDWEEMASRVMGDVLAHKLGDVVREGATWSRDNFASSQQTLADYLQEELRQLPVRDEVDGFMAEVDTLRNDVDRAEARLNRLLNKLSSVDEGVRNG